MELLLGLEPINISLRMEAPKSFLADVGNAEEGEEGK